MFTGNHTEKPADFALFGDNGIGAGYFAEKADAGRIRLRRPDKIESGIAKRQCFSAKK
ncbi:hypothetical protein GURASL_22880 [Geotalea uraniireducens]|uniref:Uncharacterized protein n=1 Tax=Geotalea uraniireducens TaxID=351604 RepID=A0ABN6VY02_9BACT|nr:hypothetical protein GURASL_22880 [Geotalea uraniireducens]